MNEKSQWCLIFKNGGNIYESILLLYINLAKDLMKEKKRMKKMCLCKEDTVQCPKLMGAVPIKRQCERE
jgi:hypothetical protein